MKHYDRKSLNIKRLLTLGVLDIRGIADKDKWLTASEYFTGVEKFIENTPVMIDTLANISASLESGVLSKELEELEGVRKILLDIGYTALESQFESIISKIRSEGIEGAEKLLEETITKINELYFIIKDTYSMKRFGTLQPESDESKRILLHEALVALDYEEANRKLRILAVDDVSVVLNTLTSILSPYYEVYALKNSEEIQKILARTVPELFLLDIEMNGMNGFELVPLIRSYEEHKDTPIIFLTGNASLDNLKDAIALGACDFITKPVNTEILLEKIEKNIVRKKSY